MFQMELSEEERITLKNLLENCLADLRMEIIQTDNINYKMMLKNRKAILLKMQQSLSIPIDQPKKIPDV